MSGTAAASNWVVRAATGADLEQIMVLEQRLFGGDAWSVEAMRGELTGEHRHYIVLAPVAEPAHVAGYAGLLCPSGAREADVQTIAVAEVARGRGQGRRLLRELLAAADARGAREVFLEVRADNPVAQSLYRSEGFEELGVRPHYYQPDDVDAIVMRARRGGDG